MSVAQQRRPQADLIPSSIRDEQCILGCILLADEVLQNVLSVLKPDDFYRDAHKLVYEAMLALYKDNKGIDVNTVTTYLEEQGQIQDISGQIDEAFYEGYSYLNELTYLVDSSYRIQNYVKPVLNTSIQRQILKANQAIAELAYDRALNAQETLMQAIKKLQDIAAGVNTGKLQHIKAGLDTFMTDLDILHHQTVKTIGVPLGYKALDNMIPGLCKGEVCIIASRPGVGKSIMLLNIALHVANSFNANTGAFYRVAFFSLEMPTRELDKRLISQKAKVDLKLLRTGDIEDNDWEDIVVARDRLEDIELYYDDTASMTVMDIKTRVQQLEQQVGKVDLVVIDYLQLLQPLEKNSRGNRVEVIGEISRSLKIMLARDLDVPVLCAAQLNRDGEKRASKRPQLSDLREGGIELDADIILMLSREDMYDKESQRPNIVDIVIAKQRNGPLGDVELYADNPHVRFVDIDKIIDEKAGY